MSSQSAPTTPTEPTARRALNRRKVLQAALDYIDSHGLEELSMRRLATELGVEAMALYNHVASKDDLQAGVAELVWEEIASAAPPDDDWPAWLWTYGRAIRDVIRRHPGTLALWVTQTIAPVPALELFDAQLERCRPGVCTREEAANALRAISAFAIGYASTELSWYPTPTSTPPESAAQQIRRVARALPPDAPDRLIDVAVLMCTGDTSHVFDTGLDLMIKGLTQPATRT